MPDMRELLDIAKEDAPPARLGVDDIVSAGRRHKRWVRVQRLGGAAAVAAVIAALLIGANVALPENRGPAADSADRPSPTSATPDEAKPAPPFSFTISPYAVDGYRVVTPREVTTGYQVASIVTGPADAERAAYVGSLTVYQPGVFDPQQVRTGPTLTVRGREAHQATVRREVHAQRRVTGTEDLETIDVDVLAWQYVPGAWAVIEEEIYYSGQQFPRAAKLALAERFATGAAVPAALPFQTAYLPAGYSLVSVSGRSFEAEDTGMVRAVYTAPDPSLDSLSQPRHFEQATTTPAVIIAIGEQDALPADAPKGRRDICVTGDHWCTMPIPNTRFYLAVNDPSKTLSDTELMKVVNGLTFTTLDHPDTWHPVT